MPDTTGARKAIQAARERHREVMGGMSMAELKLQAAGGLLRNDPDPLPYAEDDPVWLEHAEHGLEAALTACGALREAIIAAQGETAKLTGRPVPEDSAALPTAAQIRAWLTAHGWTAGKPGFAGALWTPPGGAGSGRRPARYRGR